VAIVRRLNLANNCYTIRSWKNEVPLSMDTILFLNQILKCGKGAPIVFFSVRDMGKCERSCFRFKPKKSVFFGFFPWKRKQQRVEATWNEAKLTKKMKRKAYSLSLNPINPPLPNLEHRGIVNVLCITVYRKTYTIYARVYPLPLPSLTTDLRIHGSCFFSVADKMPTKISFYSKFFAHYFLEIHLHQSSKIKK
jgi:hypothetical protein